VTAPRGALPVPDETLVARLAGGDETALQTLYRRYGRPIYGVGLRYLDDPDLAQDLVQDVFLKLWRRAETYDTEKGSFSAWIFTIARRSAIDLQRRRARRSAIPLEDAPEPSVHDETWQQLAEDWHVAEALLAMDPLLREPLLLAYYRGLTQREIADHLGVPLGTVKSRMSRGLQRLGDIMARRAALERE
jgi:RNA polymerase sigma-70 factor (ECF subfamily)